MLQIFSPILHIVFFTLLIISSDTKKFKILDAFVLPIFSFVACAFSVASKKSLPNPVLRVKPHF